MTAMEHHEQKQGSNEHHEQKVGSNYFRAGQMNNAHKYYIFSSFNKKQIEIETKVTDAIYQVYIFGGH